MKFASMSTIPDKKVDAISLDFGLTPIRLPIVLLVVYFWWIIWTPYIRFPILGDIYFEKLLAAAWLLSILMQSRKPRLGSPITTLFLLQFLLLLLLSWITWVPVSSTSILWQQTYWKKVLFFVMAVLSIRDRKDLFNAMVGIVIVVYGYQLLSWRDFLAGGSYVAQQGIKRMTGMWVANSYGAGNYWGSLSAFVLPFTLYAFHRASNQWMKYAVIPLMLLLVLSIIFSGSRGSLATMLIYIAFAFRKNLWRPKYLIVALVIAAIAIVSMPEEYKQRYSMILVNAESINTGSRNEQLAKASAASRIQGLVDGWNIMLKHPQGSGPGSSHIARLEVNPNLVGEEHTFQPHNLYGQVFGEAGVLGTFIVFLLWFRMYRILGSLGNSDSFMLEKEAVRGGMVVMLAYGMAGHTLYDYYWVWLYAFTVSIFNLDRKGASRLGAAHSKRQTIPTRPRLPARQ